MALDDGRRVEVDSRHFGGLDHAYALTINKSQGMSVDRVTFVGATFNNAELMLVALSRFKEKLTVHVAAHEVEAVRNSCARVTEKLEANDLHAFDLGFGARRDADAFKFEARLAQQRVDTLNDTLLSLPMAPKMGNIPSGDDEAADFEIPDSVRENAWRLISQALGINDVQAALASSLGLADRTAARRRWAGKAGDIIDWRQKDGGAPAWQVGRRTAGGQTDLSGVVLAEDGQRMYLAVATNGNEGQADAHTRILAFEKERLGGLSRDVIPGVRVKVSVDNGKLSLDFYEQTDPALTHTATRPGPEVEPMR